jgi:hypothetical protein
MITGSKRFIQQYLQLRWHELSDLQTRWAKIYILVSDHHIVSNVLFIFIVGNLGSYNSRLYIAYKTL